MEMLNGVVSKTIPYRPSTTITSKTQLSFCTHVCFWGLVNMNHLQLKPSIRSIKISNSKNLAGEVVNCGYENKGHLDYYGDSKTKGMGKEKRGWNRVPAKKKIKLLKGLVKDLSTFSELGFGLNFDYDDDDINQGLSVDVHDKSLIISQAAEVLLAQLKQLRLEEEKQKNKQKEKKVCKKGNCNSSSSSESSDTECDEVVDMKSLRKVSSIQPIETKGERSSSDVQLPAVKSFENEQMSLNSEQDCCNMILDATLNGDASVEVLNSSSLNLNQPSVGKRIEVCMGGKCKKSGGPALIEAFKKAIVGEGAVVECKCMGRCKSGPNVKFLNGVVGENVCDDSMQTPMNPLYIGVGLEDVDLIVASYLGEGSNLSTAVVAS